MPAPALLSLLLGAACSTETEPEPATQAVPAQVTSQAIDFGGHEPHVDVFTQVFRAFEPRSFPLQGLDRPISVDLAWWTNGTPYPSLFRLTGTFPNGDSYSTDLSTHPVLELPYQAGQTSAQIDIEHQSQSPEFRAKMIMRWPVTPSELGSCGDDARDLFARWVRSQRNWETDWQVAGIRESAPGEFSVLNCGGLCDLTIYRLLGALPALPGSAGTILQVEKASVSPYRSTIYYNSLLFHDQTGTLLRTVSGRVISTLPDGHLFLSTAMGNTGEYGIQEKVAGVTPLGVTAWTRDIGGPIPGASIATAGGNVVMPWKSNNHAGVVVLDPRTGANAAESIVERSALCTPASTSTECTSLRAEAEARFADWWQANWDDYGSRNNGPRTVCNESITSCSTAALGGWMMLGDEVVLEIDVTRVDYSLSKTSFHKRLSFHGIGDSTPHGTVAGAFYRRLGGDLLLVSEAYAAFATTAERELSSEAWIAVGARGATSWSRSMGGSPALANVKKGSFGSAGVPLPNNLALWSFYSFQNRADKSKTTTVDLATGAIVATTLPVRVLEGVCRPY